MSTALFDLTRKRAVRTGTSQGIGFALANGFAAAGAAPVLNGHCLYGDGGITASL